MPIYEYACVECGNRIEVFQRIDAESLRVCEVCGGDLRKVFHPAGIVFKGSGFYKTDSRQTSKAGKGSSEGSGEKSSEQKSDSKSEGKSGQKGDQGSSGKSERKESGS
jgi:putative FmdB family regulatory protein